MKRIFMMMLFTLLAGLLTGCGGDGASITPTTPPATADAQTGSNRPSAPAGEDFRPDPASWVANSGYPQLVEVFSYD